MGGKRAPVRYHGRLIPWDERPLESDVQADVRRLLDRAGFRVKSTSQYRSTHILRGAADLLLSHPQLAGFGAFEVKRPGEQLNPDQRTFAEQAIACHAPYCWGTDDDAQLWLLSLGMIEWTGGQLVLLPRDMIEAGGLRDPGHYVVPALDGMPWPEPLRTRLLQLELPA